MILKYLIPIDRFDIQSPLSCEDAVAALRKDVEPVKIMRFSTRGARAFQGRIGTSDFQMTRIIGYRNGFLPVVVGRLNPVPGGCVVRIRMRLDGFTITFGAIWLIAFLLIGMTVIVSSVRRSHAFDPAIFLPGVVVASFLAMVNCAFWIEAIKQKKMIEAIFKASAA